MTSSIQQLDHIVIAAPDLAQAKADFAGRTGVAPIDGGPHPGRGTRNALVSFGTNSYLEIIAPDPHQSLVGTNGAQFAELAEPVLLHWAIRTTDLAAVSAQATQLGLAPGPIHSMSRDTPEGARLNWQLLGLGGHPYAGLLPFYIDWLDCPHPALSAPVVGELSEVRLSLPVADLLALVELVPGVQGCTAATQLEVHFGSRRGPVHYSSKLPAGFGF